MYAKLVPVQAGLLVLLFVAGASAIPDGLVLTFPGGSAGPAIFDGTLHAKKGFSCDVCHTSGLFQTKKGGDKLAMDMMKTGKNCGFCHNGKQGFAMGDQANCRRCHKKK